MGKGGGLAIVDKQDTIVKKESEGNLNTFQFAKWRVTSSSNKKHLNVIAIYRPLHSTANQQTIVSFLDEFMNWLPDQLVKNADVLILGDFNIHSNDQTDEDAGTFTDTMEVLGLSQYVGHPMHSLGNTLDLILTGTNGNTQLDAIMEGPFFSDHSAVTFKLQFPRDDIRRSIIKYRRMKNLNLELFANKVNEKTEDSEYLESLVFSLETAPRETLDEPVPKITKQVTIRKNNLWFTEEIKTQKHVLRCSKKIWRQ